jgi:hypothetical protein
MNRAVRWFVAIALIALAWVFPVNELFGLVGWGPWPAASIGVFRLLGALWALAWVTGAWASWVERVSRTEDGTTLALFRIGVGLCVIYSIGHVALYGLVGVVWVDHDFGGYRSLRGSWLIQLMGGATPVNVWLLVVLSMVLGALVAIGMGGRITAVLCLQVFMGVVDNNSDAGGSYDELLTNALLLCVIAPTTTTLSVDAWLREGSFVSTRPVPVWARHLIVYQIILVYGTTGWQKLSTYWVPGGDFSALYYILQQPSWRRFDHSWIAWLYPLTQLATAVTWVWEVTAPLWLVAFWRRPTSRPWSRVFWVYLVLGVMMHATIFVLMDVGPFGLVSLAFYPAFFAPREWLSVGRRLRQRLGTTEAPATRPAGSSPVP